MNKLVSVIIPIYNVEEYLDECLSSVVSQTYRHLEVILVNDGSTDSSEIIANKYVANDVRFKLYNKVNGGLSSARNYGLDKANGDFIIFLDSDDYLRNDSISLCVNEFKKDVDIVLFAASSFDSEGGHILNEFNYNRAQTLERKPELSENYFIRNVIGQSFISSACLYMTKSELSKDLRFVPELLHEDLHYTPLLFLNKEGSKVTVINEKLYQRRVRNGSIMTSSKSIKHVESFLKIITLIMDLFFNKRNYQLDTALKVYACSLIRKVLYAIHYSDIKFFDKLLIKKDLVFLFFRYVLLDLKTFTFIFLSDIYYRFK